jgi:DNA polymerase
MSFNTALQIVQDTLTELHGNGVELRASAASLERLAATKGIHREVEKEPENEPRIRTDETRMGKAVPSPIRDHPAPSLASPTSAPPAEVAAKAARLAELRPPVLACTKCPHLVASRTQVVFGVGNPAAELMFVGEAPGADEDIQGEPFVGKAGELLTKIILAMGFAREDVYIANVLKCRPDMPPGESGNRKPRPAEMETCLPYLRQQIDIIQPRALVALGATAMEGLLGETQPMNRLRGRWHEFNGIPLMATYHPAYLLRNQALGEKRKVWEDMLMVLERLEKPISDKQRNFFLPK